MPQQPNVEIVRQEGRLLLSIRAIDLFQLQSVRQAAATFNVPKSTLYRRRAGIPSRRDCEANSKKLNKMEESALIQYILDLDSRGYSPNLNALRDFANILCAERDAAPVGKNWPTNFVKRTPELKTGWSRPYSKQRALCEDPEVISPFYDCVREKKEQYGIADEDTYNFDESGFQMGVASKLMIITATERRGSRKAIQPGNREWATAIACINAAGWAIPPYLILAAKYHLSSWYQEHKIPRD